MNDIIYPPIIKQYLQIKAKYPDKILLYRMGDFYEFFFEDAIKVSNILNIALSKRNYSNSTPIPMAGFPYHVLDNYLKKLVQHGESLAICEQIENHQESYTGNILTRQVTKVITPGTIYEDSMLAPKTENIIGAIYEIDDKFGYATLDISTGSFVGYEIPDKSYMLIKLQLTNPVELLYPKNFKHYDLFKKDYALKARPEWEFDSILAKQELKSLFNIFDIDCFGWHKAKLAIKTAGCILHYVKNHFNIQKIPHLSYLKIQYPQDTIMIDHVTVKNLQLLDEAADSCSLFKLLDNNCTNMGSRLLKRWLLNPIRDIYLIKERQQCLMYLRKVWLKIKKYLSHIGDLERVLARLSLCNLKPRDLVILRNALKFLPKIKALLGKSKISRIVKLNNMIKDFSLLYNLLRQSIAHEPAYKIQDGGVIAKDFNQELDELRRFAFSEDHDLQNLEKRERQATGIQSLKIIENKNNGYFIQIKKSISSTIKLPQKYKKIQTLKRVERFFTLELKEYENEKYMAHKRALSLEYKIYHDIINKIYEELHNLLLMSQSISELDLLTNLAERSVTLNYVCPKFTNQHILKYYGGRHPLVEQIDNNYFVKNDLSLTPKNNSLLITGPNMGGKSTYMKQTALIAIMSYIGSFVPADSAIIGPIDSIFSRMGVHDDLSTGKSTFMVEMIQTANILNNATKNSLILIDEIGRGTNNVEGISIAWGCVLHLVKIESFNLIATHYVELTKMTISKVKNIHFSISKKDKKIVFLHKLKNGAVRQSCGITVAEMAGLPQEVIKDAYKKYKELMLEE